MLRRLVLGGMLLLAFVVQSGTAARASAPDAEAAEAAPSEAGGKKAEANPAAKLNPIFPFDLGLSFWTLIVFLVALWILSKYAWGPISDGLQRRENGIIGQLNEAQKKHDDALSLLAQYEKKLAEAQAEVRALIEQGKRDAEKLGEKIVAEAREAAAGEHDRARQRNESEASSMLSELAQRSATLAVELAGKIVGAQLQPADHTRLIEQAVGAFASSGRAKVNGSSKG